jgi:hypothetical protein
MESIVLQQNRRYCLNCQVRTTTRLRPMIGAEVLAGSAARTKAFRRNTVHFVGQTIALRGLPRPAPGRRRKLIVCPTILPRK